MAKLINVNARLFKNISCCTAFIPVFLGKKITGYPHYMLELQPIRCWRQISFVLTASIKWSANASWPNMYIWHICWSRLIQWWKTPQHIWSDVCLQVCHFFNVRFSPKNIQREGWWHSRQWVSLLEGWMRGFAGVQWGRRRLFRERTTWCKCKNNYFHTSQMDCNLVNFDDENVAASLKKQYPQFHRVYTGLSRISNLV